MKFYEFMIKTRFTSCNEKRCQKSLFEWSFKDKVYHLSYIGILNGILKCLNLVAVFVSEKFQLRNRKKFLEMLERY